jgi:hypothetical protein
MANPPFKDGAKGENVWGAKFISEKDARLCVFAFLRPPSLPLVAVHSPDNEPGFATEIKNPRQRLLQRDCRII